MCLNVVSSFSYDEFHLMETHASCHVCRDSRSESFFDDESYDPTHPTHPKQLMKEQAELVVAVVAAEVSQGHRMRGPYQSLDQ